MSLSFHRRRLTLAGLGMLGLGIGYFIWYTPYAALTKALSAGLLPGMDSHVGGLVLLPAAALGTLLGVPLFLAASGWWRYVGTRPVRGRPVRLPSRTMVTAGFFMALVIATTTLNYTFAGVSILFMLLMMRGGVLIISPVVDAFRGRTVRASSWAALAFSLFAVLVALGDVNSYQLSLAAVASLAVYLAGYLGRFEIMSRVAKTGDQATDRRYFAEEAICAAVWQVGLCAAVALAGVGQVSSALRAGFTTFLLTPAALPALGIGLLYSALYVYGTLIYLDPREYTCCVPANRCASLLSGLVASFGLAWLTGIAAPGTGQLVATGFIALAIVSLCYPAVQAMGWLRRKATERLLFVCGGNVARSPMAEAIAKAEAAKLPRRFALRLEVSSAGVAPARPPSPMVPLATKALRRLEVLPDTHRSRALTAEMCLNSTAVYCMTRAQRDAVVALAPAAAKHTYLLDATADVAEPHGRTLEGYLDCARRIRQLVRSRLWERVVQARAAVTAPAASAGPASTPAASTPTASAAESAASRTPVSVGGGD
jgi:protein-tyrosine-phosphatase